LDPIGTFGRLKLAISRAETQEGDNAFKYSSLLLIIDGKITSDSSYFLNQGFLGPAKRTQLPFIGYDCHGLVRKAGRYARVRRKQKKIGHSFPDRTYLYT
jgi:hypothetical protein